MVSKNVANTPSSIAGRVEEAAAALQKELANELAEFKSTPLGSVKFAQLVEKEIGGGVS